MRQPVGSDLLRGGELVVESHNFAIAAPAGEWQWSVIEYPASALAQATYVCTETASGAELSVTVMNARMFSNRKFVAGFTNGLRETLTASGLTIGSMNMAESSLPLPGSSYRCQWQARRSDGTSAYGYCYVTGGETTYVLQHATPDSSEPAEFTQLARTFRLLHPAEPRPGTGAFLFAAGYFLFVGFGCVVAWIVNRATGRMTLNGGTVGAALVVVAMIVVAIIVNYAGFPTGVPPRNLGRITGQLVAGAVVPLLVAVWVSRSFRERRRRREAVFLRPPEAPRLPDSGPTSGQAPTAS